MKTVITTLSAILLSVSAGQAQRADTTLFTPDNTYGVISSDKILVTPTGGSQQSLAQALAAAGGNLSSPPPIGNVTPNTGAFSNLSIAGNTISCLGYGIGCAVTQSDGGGGFPVIVTKGRFGVAKASGTEAPSDFSTMEIHRQAFYSGGSGAFNSTLYVADAVGAANAGQEWNVESIISTNGNSGGGIVGGFFQSTSNLGSTDFNITLIGDYRDVSGQSTGTSGTHGGGSMELDIEGNQADNGGNGNRFGGAGVRGGVNMVAIRYNPADTTQYEVSSGLAFSTSAIGALHGGADANTNFQSAITFENNVQIRSALDTRGAVTPAGSSNPVSAVMMSAGHVIDFDGGASVTSAPGRTFSYSTGAGALLYQNAGNTEFAISDAGHIGVGAGPVGGVMIDLGGTSTVGLRTANATLTEAIRVGADQFISLDATAAHQLYYNAATGKLFYRVGGVNVMSVDGSGNAIFKGTVTQSGTP